MSTALTKTTVIPGSKVEFLPDPAGIITEQAARDWGGAITKIFRDRGTTGPITDDDQALGVVLEEAKDPSSPLHKYLPWDDAAAARQQRLNVCRRYIQHVYIRVIHKKRPSTVRAFVNVTQSNGAGRSYKPIQLIDATEQDYLINRAKAELAGWSKRYALYDHIAGISSLVRGVANLLKK